MEYYIVDAFSEQPFGGNTAGVVLIDRGCDYPDDLTLRHIAAEFRYSETAFVRAEDDGSFTTRYFTPTGEVPLCGHATIAAFGVLRERGLVTDGQHHVNRTLAGPLKVTPNPVVMMQMAVPVLIGTLDSLATQRLCRIMGLGRTTTLPVQIVSTGLPDIMLPVEDNETLQALQPDMKALSDFCQEHEVVGVHAFALGGHGVTAHVRNFAPRYGIDEEAATGTSNAALTYYLYRNEAIEPLARCTFLQGEALQRPSLITTTLTAHADTCDIETGGPYRIVAQGFLKL